MPSVDRAAFNDAVNWATRALPRTPTSPILAALRLTLTDGALTCDGFDGNVHARAVLPVEGDDFTALIPGRMFASTLANLENTTVTLDVVEDGRRLDLHSGRVRARFPVIPADTYPSLPAVVPSLGTVEAEALADAVAALAPMPARDDVGKPELTAIVLMAAEGALTFAATNSYILGRVKLPWSGPDGTVLISASHLVDACKNLTGIVSLGWTEGSATLSASGRTVTMRTVAGQPPPFARFFDATDHAIIVHTETADLVEAVKRASSFVPDKAPMVLAFEAEGIEVTGSGMGDSSITDSVSAAMSAGDPVTVGFKPAFLLAALAACSSKWVRIAITSPLKPVRFDPADGPDDGWSDVRTAVVMPVRLAE